MPECPCIDCGKPFIGNRTTKRHCGCLGFPELSFSVPQYAKEQAAPVVEKKRRYNTARYESRKAIGKLGIERDKCVDCGSIDLLAIHHIDKDKTNNALDNLQVLCRACHRLRHPELSGYLFR